MEKIREALGRDIGNYNYNEKHNCYDFKEELLDELEKADEALEKQTAKKVLVNTEIMWHICPRCHKIVHSGDRCLECNQKLDWEV